MSVVWQVNPMFDWQPAMHCVDIDCVRQAGGCPPLMTTVAQQSVLPPQSLGCRHWTVSAWLQAWEHATVCDCVLAQQTELAGHGA